MIKEHTKGIAFLAVLFLSHVYTGVYAQAETKALLPSMPSSTVASLAKYTDFPEIDQFGLAPITIPIYDLKVKTVSLPLALTYHASGVRVSQESSWVGLNFDLQGVSCISRSVRDLPDDQEVDRNLTQSMPFRYYGWLKKPDFFKDFPNLTWAIGQNDESKSAHVLSVNDGGPGTGGKADAQPDIFFLNVGELHEKFIFDHDGRIVFLEPSTKLTVTYTLNDYSKGIREFYVVDGYGNKYYFGSVDELNQEVEEITVSNIYAGTLDPYDAWSAATKTLFQKRTETQTYRTAWFLRNIVVEATNEVISFSYLPATEEFDVPLEDYYTKQSATDDATKPRPILQYRWTGLTSIKHIAKTQYLSGISTKNININFILSSRTDLNGGKKLDKIVVNAFNKIVEECRFSYSTVASGGTGDSFTLNRLYLDKVTLRDKPPYIFSYYSKDLPGKRSPQQDFWGFPCAKSTSLIPQLYVYPAQTDHLRYSCFPIIGNTDLKLLEGSDRSMDISSVYAGSLKRIWLPTAGYEEIVLQPNDFYDDNWGEIQGGGLRISEIRKLDANGNIVMKKKYNYRNGGKSSGILLNGLTFAVPTAYSIPGSGAVMFDQKSSDPDVWDYFTLRKSSNYFPLVNHSGALVSYTHVAIVETGNGKTEKTFYPSKNYLSHATQVNWARPYKRGYNPIFGTNYVDINKKVLIDLLHYNLSNVTKQELVDLYESVNQKSWGPDGVIGSSIDYYFKYNGNYIWYTNGNSFNGLIIINDERGGVPIGKIQTTGHNIYPFPTISDDGAINSGKLKEVKYFKEGESVPLRQINYTYSAVGTPVTVYGLVFASNFVCNAVLTPLTHELDWSSRYSYNVEAFINMNFDMYVMPKSWAKYKVIANQSYVVKTETISEQGSLTKVSDYSYNDNLLLAQASESASAGGKYITKYKYPNEYTYVSSTTPINQMKDRNIINTVTETQVLYEKNSSTKVVSAALTEYKMSGGLIVPYKFATYKANTDDLNPISSDVDNTGQFKADSRYIAEVVLDSYDADGNLLQHTDMKKMPTAYLWGYNNSLLIAEVKNAQANQILYTSFEEEGANFSTDSKTGNKSLNVAYTVVLPSSGTYLLTYWYKTGSDDWKFAVPQSVSANTTIGGASMLIDEVRLYPANAQMTTYTYDPSVGTTAVTDLNGQTLFYEYDVFNRLAFIKDNRRNIVKGYTYNYQFR